MSGFFMRRHAGAMHALLRITTALTFMSRGTMKLFAFPPLVAMPGQPPMPQPTLLSRMGFTAVLELVGGLLVLFGLWTRPTAFVLAGEMAVAYWLVHVPSGGRSRSTTSVSRPTCSASSSSGCRPQARVRSPSTRAADP